MAERVLGKDEVTGSIPVVGSRRVGRDFFIEGSPHVEVVTGPSAVAEELKKSDSGR